MGVIFVTFVFYRELDSLHAKLVDSEGKLDTLRKVSTVEPVLSGHSKRTQKIGFQDQLSLNAGQKYCRMLQGEHSAILSTCVKLPFSIKTFVLCIFEWPLKTSYCIRTVKAFQRFSKVNLA